MKRYNNSVKARTGRNRSGSRVRGASIEPSLDRGVVLILRGGYLVCPLDFAAALEMCSNGALWAATDPDGVPIPVVEPDECPTPVSQEPTKPSVSLMAEALEGATPPPLKRPAGISRAVLDDFAERFEKLGSTEPAVFWVTWFPERHGRSAVWLLTGSTSSVEELEFRRKWVQLCERVAKDLDPDLNAARLLARDEISFNASTAPALAAWLSTLAWRRFGEKWGDLSEAVTIDNVSMLSAEVCRHLGNSEPVVEEAATREVLSPNGVPAATTPAAEGTATHAVPASGSGPRKTRGRPPMIDVKGAELKEIWKNYSDSLVERYHVKHFAKDCDVSPDTIQRLFRGSATKDVLKVVCGVLSRCTGKRLEVSRFQVVAPQELAVDQNHNGGLQNVRK